VGDTGKYWEKLGKAGKYWEILGNTTGKYWEILGNTLKTPEIPLHSKLFARIWRPLLLRTPSQKPSFVKP
jgi:hypothetical protein